MNYVTEENGIVKTLFQTSSLQESILVDRNSKIFKKRVEESYLSSLINSAKSLDEIKGIIVDYSICDYADIDGLDLSIVKKIIINIVHILYAYPKIRGRLNYIGSDSGFLKFARNLERNIKAIRLDRVLDTSAIKALKEFVIADTINQIENNKEYYLAYFSAYFDLIHAIVIDFDDITSKYFYENLIYMENTMMSPKGCLNEDYIIHHEIGHLVDYLFDITTNDLMKNLYDSNYRYLDDRLCNYAKTSIREFFAEAFSEYYVSKKPRKLCIEVIELANRIIKNSCIF